MLKLDMATHQEEKSPKGRQRIRHPLIHIFRSLQNSKFKAIMYTERTWY